jgi:hypothetical protein
MIGDGEQTVTITGAIDDLVERPIPSLWRRCGAVQAVRKRLGDWGSETVDTNEYWL